MASSSSATSSSSSSPSSSSSTSEYMPEPVALVYPSTHFLSEKPCRPFRVITPASTIQQQNKRKRDLLDAGTGQPRAQYPEMNQFRVVVRQPLVAASPGSSFGPTGKLKAKPPKAYNTSEELLTALRKTCIEDPEVDFSGSYIVSANDAETVSDKQRVQTVTNDIWKATGYRFTVKDHPPTERGHKTRLWCSQDEARRSKHRGNSDAPRMSKQGELFAKQRFPCRSRLMITCLPPGGEGSRSAGASGRVVTIRMHHYMRHEAYLESAAEAAASGVEPVVPPPPLMSFLGAVTAPLPLGLMGMTMDMRSVGRGDIELPRAVPVAPPPPLHEQEGEWEMSHAHHDQQESPPEPAPPSPSPSPRFAPAPASAPAPARVPIEPQLEGLAHHHRPPPPPSHPHSQHSPPFQHPSHSQQPLPSHPSQQHPPPHPSQHPPTSHQHPPTSHQHPPPSHQHPPPSQHPSLPPPQPTQQQHSHTPQHTHPPAQHQHQHQHPPPPMQLTPEEFQHRMRTHIARIRDFADGLEYQVQFNDYRMLEALERDAAPFIDFLQDCLRREGRLA